jgi:hypothetical protein
LQKTGFHACDRVDLNNPSQIRARRTIAAVKQWTNHRFTADEGVINHERFFKSLHIHNSGFQLQFCSTILLMVAWRQATVHTSA